MQGGGFDRNGDGDVKILNIVSVASLTPQPSNNRMGN